MIASMGTDKDASFPVTDDGPSPAIDAAATPTVAIVVDLPSTCTCTLAETLSSHIRCLSPLSLSLSLFLSTLNPHFRLESGRRGRQ